MTSRLPPFLLLLSSALASAQVGETNDSLLVITSDASNYVLHAGGTVAKLIDGGMEGYLVRVGNDEKDSWDLSPEETALRTKRESEAAAKILGVRKVVSLGYRSSELYDIPFTSLRDRLIHYIRLYKPRILFIPNPYAHHDRNHDRHYAGRAAEDAWRAAALENYLPTAREAELPPHLTPEVYYYGPPVDPALEEPESTPTFAPQPKAVDISASLGKKIAAARALRTINHSMAMRIAQRLESTGRRLPILDDVDDTSIDQLVEERVRGLARLAAEGRELEAAEEFLYAGVGFRIPAAYR